MEHPKNRSILTIDCTIYSFHICEVFDPADPFSTKYEVYKDDEYLSMWVEYKNALEFLIGELAKLV